MHTSLNRLEYYLSLSIQGGKQENVQFPVQDSWQIPNSHLQHTENSALSML